MNGVPKGRIYLTSNIDLVLHTPQLNEFGGLVRILDMDEDNVLDHQANPMIIKATCLLPPIEAKIAESDGDECRYDYIYHDYLTANIQQEFITALIAFLYKGCDLIVYLPDEDYTNTINKFIQHLNECYGILIGIVGQPNGNREPLYNSIFIPFWAGLMYMYDIINWRDYLWMIPADIRLDNDMAAIGKLINDVRPYVGLVSYEDIFKEQVKYLVDLHQKIHKDINIAPAIMCV